MNRENKYKVWNKTNKCWDDSGDIYIGQDGELYWIEERTQFYQTYMFKKNVSDRYEIVFYTGLKDRNGKEIYESDFLEDIEGLAKVMFDMGMFMAFYRTMRGEWKPYGTLCKYMIDHNAEICGNIHENPDLLEAKTDES